MAKDNSAQFDDAIQGAAKAFNVDPDILHGIAYAESRHNPATAPSAKGAQGMMQFLPETAKRFGIDPKDPEQAVFGAAQYLRENLDKFGGDYAKAVAGYNWGENRKTFDQTDWAKKLPKETDNYVEQVLSYAANRAKPAEAKPAAAVKPVADAIPSGRGDVPEWGRKHPELYGIAGAAREVLGPIIEAGGALLGGLGGTTAGAVGGPIGAAAGGVAGAGGGYAAGKEITRLADIALGNVAPETLAQAPERMKKAALEGATMEVGGRLAAPVITKGAKMVGAGYNMLSPKAAAYLEAAEGKGQQILNALRGNTEIVPGSIPTAAEAASGVGSTKFSAMGAAAEKLKSTEAVKLRDAQKAAQLGAVRTVGQTPAELKAAEALRGKTAQELYGEADKAVVAADDTFNSLLGRPSMDKVMARARALSEEQGKPFQIGQNKPAQVTRDTLTNVETVVPAEQAKFTGNNLHNVKQAFDDLLSNPETYGIGKAEAAAIARTRAQFVNWFEGKVPAYKAARDAFAAQSKPINQMQVGQYLEGKLTPALGEETAKLRSGQFATAVDESAQTLKKATGQPRFQQLEEILTPDQMKVVNDVRADLQRQARTEYLAKQGAGSMGIEKLASRAAEGAKAPHIMSRIVTVANDLIGRMAGKLDQKLAMEIATEMLDPKLAAQALEKALARQARGEKFAEPFKVVGRAAKKVQETAGGTTAAINTLNALLGDSSLEKNQNALVK